jgi:hypothetical protein
MCVVDVEGLEGVTANQLGKVVRLMGRGVALRAHLEQRDLHTTLRQRPCGLATGEAAADHRCVHVVTG